MNTPKQLNEKRQRADSWLRDYAVGTAYVYSKCLTLASAGLQMVPWKLDATLINSYNYSS